MFYEVELAFHDWVVIEADNAQEAIDAARMFVYHGDIGAAITKEAAEEF